MARSFRIFGKKRGHRRTGSKTLASAGEAFFFAILFVAGAAFLILLLGQRVVPEWRANHEFLQQQAIALEKRIDETADADGNQIFRPQIKLQYSVDGQVYEPWTYHITGKSLTNHEDAAEALVRIKVGSEYTCWYDPLNPGVAVLVRGFNWWSWLMLLVPIGFMLIGGGRVIYTLWQWGKSPERRAAQGQLSQFDLFEVNGAATRLFPTIPDDEDLTNSPGIHLKYRLPVSGSQSWRLLAATIACLLWNAAVAIFIVSAVRAHLRGQPDWQLDLFIVPFFVVGGFLVYYFVRVWLIATGVGPTHVEISDHPLLPGSDLELHISQTGHLSMKSLDVYLKCEEIATYRQGTDSRTDRCTVHRQNLLHAADFQILPGAPYEARVSTKVPEGVMHSYRADHNLVEWSIAVHGVVGGWPEFERVFPIVLFPAHALVESTAAPATDLPNDE